MFRTLSPRSIAFLAVVSSAAGMSFGSAPSARIVPVKGESITFRRTYSDTYLKTTNPYQHLEKTDLVLKNTRGMIVATWTGKTRDFGYDEHYDSRASAICKATGKRKLECNFDPTSETGTTYITGRGNGGISVTIPIGQAVQFASREKDGMIHNTVLFGDDDDNNVFNLDRK